MAKAQAADEQCPAELALNILSGKWKLKILWHLSRGTIRFNELQRILGNITTKTLTEQLRELESQGIILRKIYLEVPPRVEYSLRPDLEAGFTGNVCMGKTVSESQEPRFHNARRNMK